MEPALDVINRALHGDPGARSFLERTTSIYVLDVTDKTQPKTYGCWNFIHQAMNEVERHESSRLPQINQHDGSPQTGLELVGHARLIATMALRVARRSPSTDKILVATCISNASEYTGTESQSQWLIDLNLELREIVIGRIAAMAFDFSFHRRTGPNGLSAFADRVVMDTFCAILSANAVASGPAAVRHFATEWIIPSSRSLPSFAVASVVLHLAGEGMRTASPAGTKDMLQQLSVSTMQVALVPTLSDAITQNSNDLNASSSYDESSQVAAMCFRAMKTWCDATDLSLPQIKHICNKVDEDIIGVINDAMYSDSHHVIDSLAELIEATLLISDEKLMSEGRMNQARHIIGVDEATFKSQLIPQQLKTIESREMALIVDDLVSGVGLQRFRFTERQSKGDYDVCRNLTRIGAAVCSTWLDIPLPDRERQPEPGAVGLLLKAAAHPSVNICALALAVLTGIMSVIPSLAQELLPMLQRRAITPHHLRGGIISLDAADLCGVNFHDFQNFREHVLNDALVVCWKAYPNHYMDSCTSAVEEFCSCKSLATEVSLQLEAALFCIEKIGSESTRSIEDYPHEEQMRRIISALAQKPVSVLVNPITQERMFLFLRKYVSWLGENGMLGIVADHVMSCFHESLSPKSESVVSVNLREYSFSPATEGAKAIKEILCDFPKHFGNDSSLATLSSMWDISCVACDRDSRLFTMEGRLDLCSGICYVLAMLPENEGNQAFEAFTAKSLGRLEQLIYHAKHAGSAEVIAASLPRIGDEIRILTGMSRNFTNARSFEYERGNGSAERQPRQRTAILVPVLDIVWKGWGNIKYVASNWSTHNSIASGLSFLLSEFLPPICDDNRSIILLKELCTLASLIMMTTSRSRAHFEVIFEFIGSFALQYGETIDRGLVASLAGVQILDNDKEVLRLLEDLIVSSIAALQESLGNVWTIPREQGNGQDAFESKPGPRIPLRLKSNECLAGVLLLLKKCLEKCPLFLLRLPASPGVNRDNDRLLLRAVDSAVDSLNDCDSEIARNAISFLTVLVEYDNSQHEALHSFVIESLSRIRNDCIRRLIMGSCGKFEYTLIGEASRLLNLLLRTRSPINEIESTLISTLRQDFFLLGDIARNAVLAIFLRHANNIDNDHVNHNMNDQANHNDNTLGKFLEKLWKLHQVEDTDSLPTSDEVSRFISMYI